MNETTGKLFYLLLPQVLHPKNGENHELLKGKIRKYRGKHFENFLSLKNLGNGKYFLMIEAI